jgi:cellulose synthase (UDP-forming)
MMTLVRPFGHLFKVTPKGRHGASGTYQSGIFWSAAALMALTVAGLTVNTIPEYQIVKTGGLLLAVAILCGINVTVLFLVCMLSLQNPTRRAEARFDIDEPISLFNSAGALIPGRSKDLSMSGLAMAIDGGRAPPALGEPVKVFIAEVGFVVGHVVRRQDAFFGIQFDLPHSVERDLLVRKLFTAGRNAVSTTASVWSATAALIRIIWSHRRAAPAAVVLEPPAELPQEVRLAARTLVITPRTETPRLAELGARRRIAA